MITYREVVERHYEHERKRRERERQAAEAAAYASVGGDPREVREYADTDG